jgi:hypothetical protein
MIKYGISQKLSQKLENFHNFTLDRFSDLERIRFDVIKATQNSQDKEFLSLQKKLKLYVSILFLGSKVFCTSSILENITNNHTFIEYAKYCVLRPIKYREQEVVLELICLE